jgi:hypothetical protein
LDTCLATSKLRIKDLEEWPIFREFRKEERIQQMIAAEHLNSQASVKYSPTGLTDESEDEEAETGQVSKGNPQIN